MSSWVKARDFSTLLSLLHSIIFFSCQPDLVLFWGQKSQQLIQNTFEKLSSNSSVLQHWKHFLPHFDHLNVVKLNMIPFVRHLDYAITSAKLPLLHLDYLKTTIELPLTTTELHLHHTWSHLCLVWPRRDYSLTTFSPSQMSWPRLRLVWPCRGLEWTLEWTLRTGVGPFMSGMGPFKPKMYPRPDRTPRVYGFPEAWDEPLIPAMDPLGLGR